MELPEFLKNIDYDSLRDQKQELLEVINNTENRTELDGIVHLIDAIQDNAVENLGMTNEQIFGFK